MINSARSDFCVSCVPYILVVVTKLKSDLIWMISTELEICQKIILSHLYLSSNFFPVVENKTLLNHVSAIHLSGFDWAYSSSEHFIVPYLGKFLHFLICKYHEFNFYLSQLVIQTGMVLGVFITELHILQMHWMRRFPTSCL